MSKKQQVLSFSAELAELFKEQVTSLNARLHQYDDYELAKMSPEELRNFSHSIANEHTADLITIDPNIRQDGLQDVATKDDRENNIHRVTLFVYVPYTGSQAYVTAFLKECTTIQHLKPFAYSNEIRLAFENQIFDGLVLNAQIMKYVKYLQDQLERLNAEIKTTNDMLPYTALMLVQKKAGRPAEFEAQAKLLNIPNQRP